MAYGNRKGFEAFVLDVMGQITSGGGNRIIYERLFAVANDDQIEDIVKRIEAGMGLSIWASNYKKSEKIVYENILKLCEKYNISLEQQLVVYDEDTGIKSLTSFKAMIGIAEIRKQRQMLVKKLGVAKNDHNIDDMTGQVMGDSRAGGISQPEITVLRNLGLYTMANELYNVQGGDTEALKAYRNDILTTGKTTTNASLRKGTIAKSLDTAYHLMRGRHLDSNLNRRYG